MTSSTGASRRSPRVSRLADAVLHPGFAGTVPPAWLLRRVEAGLGGVALFSRNVESWEQVAALTGMLRRANLDLTVAVDEETGVVTRLQARTGSTRPGACALGVVDDVDLTAAVAEDLGGALRDAGITLNYAPVADVNSDPRNPVIGVRSFGSDPHLVARHTAAWIRGQQRAGVAACAKHFPGHGDTRTDSHLEDAVVAVSRDELAARELHPFRAAIAAGVRAVMIGHLMVPAVDPRQPSTVSRAVVTGLLREEMGFTGPAITDAIEMRAVASRYGLPGAAVRALAAGADTICVGGEHADEGTATMLRDAIVDAVAAGHLSEQRLAEAAGRVAALTRWSRAHAARRRTYRDAAIGMSAARRAVRVATSGSAPTLPLRTGPHVVGFCADASPVVGSEPPPGLGSLLAPALPGTTAVQLTRADVAARCWEREVLAAAANRPLVVVVCDAHRHTWISGALAVLATARADCVVVDTGLGADPRGAVYLCTYGSSLASRQTAVEMLAGPRAVAE
ncbi:glycoside hydrolase family 3 protein [Krasilnikovia sp. MM14-A1259]|uniref:glycoside hydrolase family 3 protein n=1 Tax=Krasilnikovia sp. MM14-A1259 TaxID=3373539 RepID=UPI00399D020D